MLTRVRERLSKLFPSKRPIRLTSAGWVFILYTIGVGAGAINTGNNLLYLIFGIFLGLILASGVLSDLSLWGLAVDWEFPQTAEAGRPAYLLLRITNLKSRLPSLCVSIELDGVLRGRPVRLHAFVPIVRARETILQQCVFVPSIRGWFQMTDLKLTTRYPFGLLQKIWKVHETTQKKSQTSLANGLFVYPDLVEIGADELTLGQTSERDDTYRSVIGDGTTSHGIREFRYADNPRRIHWKASAKRAWGSNEMVPSWLIREMEKDQAQDVILQWPSLASIKEYISDPEDFIRYTASLLWQFQTLGQKTELWIGRDQRVSSDWEFLALFDTDAPNSPRIAGYLEQMNSNSLVGRSRLLDVGTHFLNWKEKRRGS